MKMGVSENGCVPHCAQSGFADHYPVFKWLFHWEYPLFSDKPKYVKMLGKITLSLRLVNDQQIFLSSRFWYRHINDENKSSVFVFFFGGG